MRCWLLVQVWCRFPPEINPRWAKPDTAPPPPLKLSKIQRIKISLSPPWMNLEIPDVFLFCLASVYTITLLPSCQGVLSSGVKLDNSWWIIASYYPPIICPAATSSTVIFPTQISEKYSASSSTAWQASS